MSSVQPRLFLCVDCGGTKTSAVLVDGSGNVAGRGAGGPSNFMDVGMKAFLRSVKTAVEAALEEAVGSKVNTTFQRSVVCNRTAKRDLFHRPFCPRRPLL
jgi:N-acetylglucosamine kinase-like BadF-type ATPase